MFENVVQDLLRTYLRDYLCIDEVSLNKIVVSLWAGQLEIENLELQTKALEQLLGLRVKTTSSIIRKLHVTVPWSALQSKPVVVKLEGIEIIAQPFDGVTCSFANRIAASRKLEKDKITKLEELDKLEKQKEEPAGLSVDAKEGSFLEKLATKILDNLQLVLEDVHIRFEENRRVTGVRFGEISLLSANDKWVAAFVNNDTIMRKLARVKDFRVYVGDAKGDKGEHDVFSQLDIVTKLTLHKDAASSKTSLVDVAIDLGESLVSIRQSQMLALCSPSQTSSFDSMNTKQRWKWACREVLDQIHASKQETYRLEWLRANRDRYVSLFSRTLVCTKMWLKKNLTEEEERELAELEHDGRMHFSDIVQLRKVAYQEARLQLGDPNVNVKARRETASEKASAQEKAKANKGWISSWWYGDKTKDNEDGTTSEVEATETTKRITAKDREELFDTIGYDPETDGGMSIEDLQAIRFSVNASVSSVSITIINEMQIPIAEVADCVLGAVNLEVEFQEYVHSVNLVAESLVLQDSGTQGTEFQDIIAPVDESTTAKLLVFNFSKTTKQDNAKVNVQLEQALKIVFSKEFVETVSDILFPDVSKKKANVDDGLDQLVGVGQSVSTWESYQAAYSETNFEDILSENALPDVSFSFAAPQVVIPYDVQQHNTPRLVLHLGDFKFGQQESVEKWRLTGSNMFVTLMWPADANQCELISGVSFHATLETCSDRKLLTKPRFDLGFVLPKLSFTLPLHAVRDLQDIVSRNLGTAYGQGTNHEASPSSVASLDKNHMIKHPSETISMVRNSQLAQRVSIQVNAEIQTVSFSFISPKVTLTFDLQGMFIHYKARQFDSSLNFVTNGILLSEEKQNVKLLCNEGSSASASLVVRSATKYSPLFEDCNTFVEVKFGMIGLFIPHELVHELSGIWTDMVPSSGEMRTRQAVGSRSTSFTPSQTTSENLFRYIFLAETAHLTLTKEHHTVCEFSMGQAELQLENAKRSFNLSGLRASKGERENATQLLKVVGGSDAMVSIEWKAESGYVVEVDPFEAVLDQSLFYSIKTFIPDLPSLSVETVPPGTPNAPTTAQTQMPTTNNSIELRIRQNDRQEDQPFIVEFISTEAHTCQARIHGLSLNEKVTLNRVDIVANGTERIASVEGITVVNSQITIESAEVVINPASRQLVHSLTPESIPNLASGGGGAESSGQPLALSINRCAIVTRDMNNMHGITLLGTNILYCNSKLQIQSLRLHEESHTDKVLLSHGPVPFGQYILDVEIGTPTVVSLLQETVTLTLSPTSYAVILSIINTLLGVVNLVVAVFSEDTVAPVVDETDYDVFVLNWPALDLIILSMRPHAENVNTVWKHGKLTVDSSSKLGLSFDELSLCDTTFSLSVEMLFGEVQTSIDVTVQEGEEKKPLLLNPAIAYSVVACLNHNILWKSDKLVYDPPNENPGEVSFSLKMQPAFRCMLEDGKNPIAYITLNEMVFDSNSKGISYSSQMMRAFSPNYFGIEYEYAKLENFSLSIKEEEDGETGATSISWVVTSSTVHLQYDFRILQEIFNFVAGYVRAGVENTLAAELALADKGKEYVDNHSFFVSVDISSFSAIIPGMHGKNCVVLNSRFHGLLNTDYETEMSTQVLQITVSKTEMLFGVLSRVLLVTSSVPLVHEMDALIRVKTKANRDGLNLSTDFSFSFSKVKLDAVMKVFPMFGSIVLFSIRNRPSQKVIRAARRQTVLKKRELTQPEIDAVQATYTISVSLDGFTLTVLGIDQPIFRLKVEDPCTANGSSVGKSNALSIDEVSIKVGMSIRGCSWECFNPRNLTWEPILETCDVSSSIETIPHRIHKGFIVGFSSSTPIRFNLYPAHMKAIFSGAMDGQKLLESISMEGSDNFGSVRDVFTKGMSVGAKKHCTVINRTAFPVTAQGVVISPGSSCSVASNNMRILIEVLECSEEVLLANMNAQIISAPIIAGYVNKTADLFSLTIASTLRFRNNCDIPISVMLTEQRPTENPYPPEILVFGPKETCFIPSALVDNCAVRFRLSESDAWNGIMLPNPSQPPEPFHEVIDFLSSHKTLVVSSGKQTNFPLLKYSVAPVKAIENMLPVKLRCRLYRKVSNGVAELEHEEILLPGSSWCIYNQSPRELYLRFGFANVEVFGSYIALIQQSGQFRYKFVNTSGTMKQEFRYINTPWNIRVFAPFWIVNSCDLDLSYALSDCTFPLNMASSVCADGTANPRPLPPPPPPPRPPSVRQMPSGGTQSSPQTGIEEAWENQRKYMLRGWSSELLIGERPSWSDEAGKCTRNRDLIKLPPGWVWSGSWTIDRTVENTGEDGWQYALGFGTNTKWSRKEGWSDIVRRRKWVRSSSTTALPPPPPPPRDDKAPTSSADDENAVVDAAPHIFPHGYDAIRVCLGQGNSSLWSEPLALNIVSGSSNVFPVKRRSGDGSFFEFVLTVNKHETIPRTTICTITPRMVLVNNMKSKSRLSCIQAGSHLEPIRVEGAVPMFWEKATPQRLLQLQVGVSANWSSAFSVDTLGETCVAVDNMNVCIEVKRGVPTESTLLVIFKQDNEEEPMNKIQNITMDRIKYSQKGSVERNDLVVSQYGTRGFGWIEPLKPHVIVLGFVGTDVSVEVDINKIGTEVQVPLPPTKIEQQEALIRTLYPESKFFLQTSAGSKWMGKHPGFEVESVLESATSSISGKDWIAFTSLEKGFAISMERLNKKDGPGTNVPLCYGDTCTISCTSSDGRERLLVRPEVLVRTQSSINQTKLVWRCKEFVIVSDESTTEHEDAEFIPEHEEAARGLLYRFILTGGAPGTSVEESKQFSLASAVDMGRVVSFDKDTQELILGTVESAGEESFSAISLDSVGELGRRSAFVNVDIAGDSRVIRVSESSLSSDKDDGVTEQVRLDFSVAFEDFGLSVILDATDPSDTPKELLFLSNSFQFRMVDTNLNRAYDMTANSIRIDDDLEDATYPNLLRRTFQPQPQNGDTKKPRPVLLLSLLQKHTQLNVLYFQKFNCQWSEIDVQIDENFITAATILGDQIGAALTWASQDGTYSDTELAYDLPQNNFYSICDQSIKNENKGTRTYYFREFEMGEINLKFSYFRNQMTEISGVPIKFEPLKYSQIAALSTDLSNDVVTFYKTQVQKHLFKIIGYALPGNPGEIFNAFGNVDSVGDVFKGAVRGVGASVGTLGSTVAKVDWDRKRQSSKPQTVQEGFARGTSELGQGFKDGLQGLVSKPVAGAEQDGISGALSGFGAGVVGLFTKPVAGVASAIASASDGVISQTKTQEQLNAERQTGLRSRPIRFFRGSNIHTHLGQYSLKQRCILWNAMDLLNDFGEETDTTFLNDYFFTPLPFFVLHTASTVAFGTYQEGKLPPFSDLSLAAQSDFLSARSVYGSEEQLQCLTYLYSIKISIIWREERCMDSAHSIQLAVKRWIADMNVTSFNACEAKLRKQCINFTPPDVPTLDPSSVNNDLELGKVPRRDVGKNVALYADVVKRFRESFQVRNSVRIVMHCLVNTWEACEKLLPEDPYLVARRVVIESRTFEGFPLVTLSLARAYFFFLWGSNLQAVNNQRYLKALEAFERLYLSLATSN